MQRAVDRLKPAADRVLRAALPAMSRAALDELDRSDARLARPARIILTEEAQFATDLYVAFDRAVDAAVAEFGGERAAEKSKLDLASLALVDFDQMEERMVVDRMGARLRNAIDDFFTVLNQRLANLVRAPRLGDRDNPFHPLRFAQAIDAAIERRGLSGETRIALLKGFEHALLETLKQVYDEMNLQLAAEGVSDIADPELLRHTMIGARAAQAQRPWVNTLAGQVHFDGAPLLPELPAETGEHAEQLLAALYQKLQGSSAAPAPAAAAGIPAGSTLGSTPDQLPRMPFGQVEPIMAAPPALAPGLMLGQDGVLVDPRLLAAIVEQQQLTAKLVLDGGGEVVGQSAQDLAEEEASRRAELIDRATRQVDKLTIELVGLLFDRIHNDKYLPEEIKSVLARLQFPFLRAALSDPDLFVASEAPARRLMDRIASSAVGWTAQGFENQRYFTEVERAVNTVMLDVDNGALAFERALGEFETFLVSERTRDDDPVLRAKRALEEVETREVMAINAAIGVRRAFEGVLLESYLREFLLGPWVHVLVAATLRARLEPGFDARFKDVVPDLVWSVQPKLSQEDRRRLVSVIPRALSAMRDGLALIEWPQARVSEFFARLMASHANAVKALEIAHGVQPPVVDANALREKLARVDIVLPPADRYVGEIDVETQIVRREVERSNADVTVLDRVSGPVDVTIPAAHFSDHEIDALVDDWQRGDWFILRVGQAEERVRLRWISPRRSFYLFAAAGSGAAHSLSPDVLRSYVRSGRLRPVEPQPLFDRLVTRIFEELGGGKKAS